MSLSKRKMKNPADLIGDSPAGQPQKADDNDDKDVIHPSPFKRPKSAEKKKAAAPTITIYHVQPTPTPEANEVGMEGYIVHVSGYLGSKVANAVYKKNTDAVALLFVNATMPVPHVFEDFFVDGVKITNESTDGRVFDCKVLVHLLEEEHVVTKEQLFQMVEKTFIPALMKQKGVYPNSRPILHPTKPYVVLRSWAEALGDSEGLAELYTHGVKMGSNVSFGAWLRADKFNVYNFWQIGKVPLVVKKKYNLTKEHLYPEDHEAEPISELTKKLNKEAEHNSRIQKRSAAGPGHNGQLLDTDDEADDNDAAEQAKNNSTKDKGKVDVENNNDEKKQDETTK